MNKCKDIRPLKRPTCPEFTPVYLFSYLFQFMATNTTNKNSNNNDINKNRESHCSCAKEPETPYKAKKT